MTAERDNNEANVVIVDEMLTSGAWVRWLEMSRPEDRNPLDVQTVSELLRASRDAIDRGFRGIVVTGSGEAFSAGGDLKGYQQLYRDEVAFDSFLKQFGELCDLYETAPVVTIALVNGTCLAGGLELSLAMDLIVIANDAKIGDGHLRFGQLPGAGGSQRLCRAIGTARAKAWLLSGRLFTALEAVDAGLAVQAVPQDELHDTARRWLTDLCSHSPLAYRTMKTLIRIADERTRQDGLDQERAIVTRYATTAHDATEGLVAFRERRLPRFRGT